MAGSPTLLGERSHFNFCITLPLPMRDEQAHHPSLGCVSQSIVAYIFLHSVNFHHFKHCLVLLLTTSICFPFHHLITDEIQKVLDWMMWLSLHKVAALQCASNPWVYSILHFVATATSKQKPDGSDHGVGLNNKTEASKNLLLILNMNGFTRKGKC